MRKSFRGVLLATLFGLLVTLGQRRLHRRLQCQIIRQGNTCALDLSRDIKVTGEAYRIQWRVQGLKVSEQHLLTNWRVAQYVWPALYNFLILYITEKFYFL